MEYPVLYWVVAIAGPSGTLKQLIGFRLAKRLGYGYIDVGLIWRLLALRLLRLAKQGRVGLDDEAACARVADGLDVKAIGLSYIKLLDGTKVRRSTLEGTDILECIAQISQLPSVREAVAGVVRRMYREPGTVVVGRPFVYAMAFPNAFVRYLLHDNVGKRAARNKDGESPEAMIQRDEHDEYVSRRQLMGLPSGHHACIPLTGRSVPWVVTTLEHITLSYRSLYESRPKRAKAP